MRAPLLPSPPTFPGPVPADASSSQLNGQDAATPFASPLDRDTPQHFGVVTHEPEFRAPAFDDPHSQRRPFSPSGAMPALVAGRGAAAGARRSRALFVFVRCRSDSARFSHPAGAGPRPSANLARQRSDHAEAAAVIDRIGYFYEHENSNVHRAAHELAARATDAYESAA